MQASEIVRTMLLCHYTTCTWMIFNVCAVWRRFAHINGTIIPAFINTPTLTLRTQDVECMVYADHVRNIPKHEHFPGNHAAGRTMHSKDLILSLSFRA